jgi:hypothetical protein
MHPSTLPPSYVRFIRKQGAKELYVYQGIQVGAHTLHTCASPGAKTRRETAWRCGAPRGEAGGAPHGLPRPHAPPQELALRSAARLPLSPLDALAGTPHAGCDGSVPCSFFHPGQSCAGHALSILPHNFERAIKVVGELGTAAGSRPGRERASSRPVPLSQRAPRLRADQGRLSQARAAR